MSYPGRPPMVPYGLAPGVVTMPMATHVMVGAYGAGGVGGVPAPQSRTALLPAPTGAGKPGISRGPTRNGAHSENPPVTVFIGNISPRCPEAMARALLSCCGPVCSWKRAGTFGFAEFWGAEAALRCVRLLHERQVADRKLVARVDGKMQALVDTYKSEQRSKMNSEDRAPGTEGASGGASAGEGAYLDARGRALDDTAERSINKVLRDYQDEINNYETLQKEEMLSKTAKVLEEADISEEKRDVIHREIGKFRESMKGQTVTSRQPLPPAPSPRERSPHTDTTQTSDSHSHKHTRTYSSRSSNNRWSSGSHRRPDYSSTSRDRRRRRSRSPRYRSRR